MDGPTVVSIALVCLLIGLVVLFACAPPAN